jgi:peptidoglycan/LPS O-acetylase OafA/YrhL
MVYTLTEWGDSGRWLPFYSPQTNLWYFLIGIVLWFAKDHTNIKYILLEIIGCILALSIFRYDSYEFYAMCTALMLSVYWTLPRKELPHLKIIDKFNTIGYAFWLVHPIILVLIGKFSEKYTVKGYGYIDWLLILALSIVCAWLLTISVNKVVNNIRGKQL